MPKTKTSDLIKDEPYSSIIHMLTAFPDEGLKNRHFRYELIGEHDLKPQIAKKVNDDLIKRRYKYIHKITRGYFKEKKTPGTSLEGTLNILMDHNVIYRKNQIYKLTSKKFYIKLVAEEDKKNIDYNVMIEKLNTIEDLGINIYGLPPADLVNIICSDKKNYLKKLYIGGISQIALGTNILQKMIIHISSQIRVNVWNDVVNILENKKISLLDRQILLSFFVISLYSSLVTYYYYKSWFDTENNDFWFLKEEWITEYASSDDGRIRHPIKKITVKNPDSDLREMIKIMNPHKKEGDIHLELKNHEIGKDVSYLIISLLMLPSVPEAIGTLCVVSSPPTHRFFDPLEIALSLAMTNISPEMAMTKLQEASSEKRMKARSAETFEEWKKIMSDVFKSDELNENLMASYKEKKLDYRVKLADAERETLEYIIGQEKKSSELLLSLFELMENHDYVNILKKLAPKK